MESSFIEEAAREAAEAEVVAGDPEADALLRAARKRIYHWPAEFPGFTCVLVYSVGAESFKGELRCRGSRKLELDIPGLADTRWLRFQLEELAAHREAPTVSKMASRTGCVLGDWDALYGRRIDFVGDKMSSFYRIKDQKLTQIGRSYKNQDFTINIDAHQDCGGHWSASFYSAYYWSREDRRLVKTETYLDRYREMGGVFLPQERRVSEATDYGLSIRSLQFSSLALL